MKKPKAAPSPLLRRILAFIGFLAFLVLASTIGALVLARSLDRPPESAGSGSATGTEFAVESGESSGGVANRLESQGLIRSAVFFKAILKLRGQESMLKAGRYLIGPQASTSDIIAQLVDGRQLLARLRVPEGASLARIAALAEEAGIATADELKRMANDKAFASGLGLPDGAGLEGYLYPDTYLLPLNAGAESTLKLMVGTFRERVAKEIPESASLSAMELHQRVILASIVEREYRLPEEAPIMASVFYNRLKIGMALQSCATVVYVITERLGKTHPTRLFDRDLELVDPFNTYQQPGLPPAPISNPGLVALTAAFRPESSRYLYFRLVDDATGKHYFSETLDEHIRAGSLSVKPGSP